MFRFLKPDLTYSDADILGVRLEDLKSLQVEALLIDLDNTLIAPKTARIDMPVKYWLELMKKHFEIIVLSNNKVPTYLKACEHILELPVIGFAHKPWKNGANKAVEMLKIPNEKICVIGDRPLTDIWLAKNCNMKSVLVKALMADVEPKWKFYLRKLEWSFIKKDNEKN